MRTLCLVLIVDCCLAESHLNQRTEDPDQMRAAAFVEAGCSQTPTLTISFYCAIAFGLLR